jgi:hypothetical protein
VDFSRRERERKNGNVSVTDRRGYMYKFQSQTRKMKIGGEQPQINKKQGDLFKDGEQQRAALDETKRERSWLRQAAEL